MKITNHMILGFGFHFAADARIANLTQVSHAFCIFVSGMSNSFSYLSEYSCVCNLSLRYVEMAYSLCFRDRMQGKGVKAKTMVLSRVSVGGTGTRVYLGVSGSVTEGLSSVSA